MTFTNISKNKINEQIIKTVDDLFRINKDQLANGVDFIFNEENQCKYQIANLKIESYSDLKTEKIKNNYQLILEKSFPYQEMKNLFCQLPYKSSLHLGLVRRS